MAAGLPGGPVMVQEDRCAKTNIRIACRSLSRMALASVLVVCGCLSGGTTRKTASVKAAKNVGVSPAELSSRNRSLLGTYSGEIEAAADSIIFKSPSAVTRRQGLVWKSETIPVLQRSLLNTDPIAAVLDTW